MGYSDDFCGKQNQNLQKAYTYLMIVTSQPSHSQRAFYPHWPSFGSNKIV